mgnify:CR=1 FL=1
MAPHTKLKPREIIEHLRNEFEERLCRPGVAWNTTGILHVFDLAVGTTAFWYADCLMEPRPTLETHDEQTFSD